MSQCTVIDAWGAPLFELGGSADQMQANVPHGASLVAGHALGDWWDGEQWRTKPEQPSRHHAWDWSSHSWQDLRTPGQMAADAQAELEAAWAAVRIRRDALLAKSDWTQLPDISPATQLRWQPYRQALRDISQQPDPNNITWPVVPVERT